MRANWIMGAPVKQERRQIGGDAQVERHSLRGNQIAHRIGRLAYKLNQRDFLADQRRFADFDPREVQNIFGDIKQVLRAASDRDP